MSDTVDEQRIFEILEQLRDAKFRAGLSCEQIAKITEKNGTPVHIKTIRRALNLHGADTNFRLSTLQYIAVALGVDLKNQAANEAIAREYAAMEQELNGCKATIAAMTKSLDAMTVQIESMRTTVHGNEEHLRERDKQIEKLTEQNHILERNARRKDKFLHIYTVSCLGVAVTGCLLFASGWLTAGARK